MSEGRGTDDAERASSRSVTADYRATATSGFLRNRRAQLAPDPSWPVYNATTDRRVAGLRREEIAWAAGVSMDYYTKFEQGKVAHPSRAVVGSVADALRLSDLDRRYLLALTAEPSGAPEITAEALDEAQGDLLTIGSKLFDTVMLHLLTDELMLTTVDKATAAVLFPDRDSSEWPIQPVSLLQYIFDDPISRSVYVDWTAKAYEVVGLAHLNLATRQAQPEHRALIDQLWRSSKAFRYIWNRYEPHEKRSGRWRIRVPGEGVVGCHFTTLQVRGCDELSLVVYDREEQRRELSSRDTSNTSTGSAAPVRDSADSDRRR